MTDKERLQHIKKELEAILKEIQPRLNEFIYMKECLEDLHRVSDGEDPERL